MVWRNINSLEFVPRAVMFNYMEFIPNDSLSVEGLARDEFRFRYLERNFEVLQTNDSLNSWEYRDHVKVVARNAFKTIFTTVLPSDKFLITYSFVFTINDSFEMRWRLIDLR